ncbi:copper-binding protein [Henriciella sp.]|jgi:Cu/Ag efflux protein CusF|uniref:copper-binding protein n=1 Tax=Henriciella sp. TaxID=1968823 RepID=UPI000C112F3E|nr:copper-binding protein [Henriciella sp.]PHR81259.1 MAG: cation transporter [Henriciella sp.]
MKTLVRKTTVTGAILGMALIGPALAQEAGMKMDKMNHKDMSGMSCCGDMAPGFGVVNSVDLDARTVNISHDPIKKIGWGEMTMDFDVGKMVALDKFETGDNVHFMLKEDQSENHDIAMMMPIGGDPDAFKQSMMSMMKGGDMMGCDGMDGNGSMSGMSGKDHEDAGH